MEENNNQNPAPGQQKQDQKLLYDAALAALSDGNLDEAEDYARLLLKDDGSNPDYQKLMSDITRMRNEAVDLNNKEYEEVKAMMNAGNLYSALDKINALVKVAPNEEYMQLRNEVRSRLVSQIKQKVRSAIDEQRFDDALIAWDEAQKINKDDAELPQLYNVIIAKRGDIEAAKRRRKTAIGIVVAVVVVIIAVVWGVYSVNKSSAETDLWNQIETSPDSALIAEYISEYPNGAHIDEVRQLQQEMKAEQAAWQTLCMSDDYQDYLTYADNNSDSPYKNMALARADSLCWNQANVSQNPDDFDKYCQLFPQGKHYADAQNKIKDLAQMQVSGEEQAGVTGALQNFFNALGNQDETGVTSAIAPVMSYFINKQNATKADVLNFMAKSHSEDINTMTYTVNSATTITKFKMDNGQYGYKVTAPMDLTIDRNNPNMPTFISYVVNAQLDNNQHITFLTLKKVSSR